MSPIPTPDQPSTFPHADISGKDHAAPATPTPLDSAARDHGGRIDAAMAQYGGARGDWVDLSTGINPEPFVFDAPDALSWGALPDHGAQERLIDAARKFWQVPPVAAVLATPGASSIIAQIPYLHGPKCASAWVPGPTYNEHAAAFAGAGWAVDDHRTMPRGEIDAITIVHPNNPDGHMWRDLPTATGPLLVIDESFCDVTPDASLVPFARRPNTLILKSFGKFWGLAGLRLGFAIGDPALINALAARLGPWPVSGPALAIGTQALNDPTWAAATRARLARDAARLDGLMGASRVLGGATGLGGTDLFRLYRVADAAAWQAHLGRHHILARPFPYDPHWLRLGLPRADQWAQLEAAL